MRTFAPPLLISQRRAVPNRLNSWPTMCLWNSSSKGGKVFSHDTRMQSQPSEEGSMYIIPHRET